MIQFLTVLKKPPETKKQLKCQDFLSARGFRSDVPTKQQWKEITGNQQKE